MQYLSFLSLFVLMCLSCTAPKKEASSTDSLINMVDSEIAPTLKDTPITPVESPHPTDEGTLSGNTYTITNQSGFITDPFEFSLYAESIKDILGDEAKIVEEEFEGGEDYSAYTHTSVTYRGSELKFYSYSGKHYADITTPLLPLKYNIKIGISKTSFIEALSLTNVEATQADKFEINDYYGSMNFTFTADTLSSIYINYEEGD